MQRRLAIARAMLHDPQLLILDEPTVGVDPHSRRAIYDRIRALRDAGKTVLLTTNTLDEAQELCDQVAIIDHGRLIALDTPGQLRRSLGGNILTLAVRATAGNLEPAVESLKLEGYAEKVAVIHQPGHGPDSYLLKIASNGSAENTGPIIHIVSRWCDVQVEGSQPSLDDVFLTLTGPGLRD